MTTNPNDASKSSTDPDDAITAILAGPGTPGADAGTRTALTPPAASDLPATPGASATPEPPLPPVPPVPLASPVSSVSPVSPARPTVRWGALVWALLFGATAATTLWVLVDSARRDLVGDWLVTLSPLTATLVAVIIVGVVLALFGIVGLIRRAERARS
ncbi:hypothetical protein [Agromyces sp. CCNWLW203]|uniref:hypothetical protein n=1 Tax=Agromyces sp. CCNWLW203 TaxID=3112842 RepID=UPI002F9615FD